MQSIFTRSTAVFIFIFLTTPSFSHPGHMNDSIHTHFGLEGLIFIACLLFFYKLLKNK